MPGAREPSQARTQGAYGLGSPDATEDDTLVIDDDAARFPSRLEAIAHVAQTVMQGAGWRVAIGHIAGAWGGGVGTFRGQPHGQPAVFARGVAIDAGEPE